MSNKFQVRVMEPGDVERCCQIDSEIYGKALWSRGQWRKFNQRQNTSTSVIEWRGDIVGFLCEGCSARRCRIYRLIVDPWCRFGRVGTDLFRLATAIAATIEDEAKSIVMDVREDDLDAQLFLAKMGMSSKVAIKPPSVRDGWLTPEIQGEEIICRFTMTARKVGSLCRRVERAAR